MGSVENVMLVSPQTRRGGAEVRGELAARRFFSAYLCGNSASLRRNRLTQFIALLFARHQRLRIQTILLSLLIGLHSIDGRASNKSELASLDVSWEPGALVDGAPCLFRVKSSKPLRALRGQWLGRTVFFNFDAPSATWYGLAGIGLDTAVSAHRLTLNATPVQGARFSFTQPVFVGRGAYETASLSVDRQFTAPDAEELARIRRDQAFKREAFRRITAEPLWRGAFVAPVDSIVTGEFGTKREFNGQVRSAHQGLDLRAAIGTPIGAMNSGTVIIAREMFYEGGFVVIDHGQGLLSLYLHLSEIKVREGETVTKKQIIGLSGDTGRTTAPHLHVGIRWQGVYVDPATLMRLKLF
jgi:murein DD-endopeptidase MepM/ murein hydrolase activator NlpD